MPDQNGNHTQEELQQLLAQATAANQGLNVGGGTPGQQMIQRGVDAATAGAMARNDLPNRGLAGLPQQPQQGLLASLLASVMPSARSMAAPTQAGGITAEELAARQRKFAGQ